MIAYTCSSCGNVKQLPDDLAGRRVQCKKCGTKGRADYPVGRAAEPSGKEVEELWRAALDEEIARKKIKPPPDEPIEDDWVVRPSKWRPPEPPTPPPVEPAPYYNADAERIKLLENLLAQQAATQNQMANELREIRSNSGCIVQFVQVWVFLIIVAVVLTCMGIIRH